MGNIKMALGVKELRKRKGLSQEDLGKQSGLSLRTIQRVENGETEPTGETLRRIASILEVTTNDLMNWETNKAQLKTTVKTKHEYLHIFDSQFVFTKTPEIKNLVEDYAKSVNNVFKSLMVFFVFIPIFTTLAVILYNMEMLGLAIYSGSFAFFFVTMAFYSMLFTSGSSLIKMDHIYKIKIQKRLFNNVVAILHKESGRLKTRYLILEENQVETVKDVLLSEKLIEEKDIPLKRKKISRVTIIALISLFFIGLNLMQFKIGAGNKKYIMMNYGLYMLLLSAIVITIMVIRFYKSSYYKNNKPITRI